MDELTQRTEGIIMNKFTVTLAGLRKAGACFAAAWAAARDAQKDMLIKMLEGNAPWQV